MSEINLPAVVAELTSASDRYEAALVRNDVPVLQELFWDSPHVVRFGATENLHGTAEIEAFRKSRPAAGLARTTVRRDIVTFGNDTGSVTLEFARGGNDSPQIFGRQSQFWRRFPQGWRVVSAHVSLLPAGPPAATTAVNVSQNPAP
jgi:hypothetical protein